MIRLDTVFILFNRLKGSPKICKETVFTCTDLEDEDTLSFVFQCRSEEWLRAEGIVRKRRRRREKPKPAEDSEGSPLPKSEPVEEVVPADGVPAGGVEMIPTTRSPPRLLSMTPLSYADEESLTQHGERADHTLYPTLTPPDFVTLEPPRKISKRSGNFTFTINGETRSMTTEARSVRQTPAEGGSGSNVQVEGGGLMSDVGAEGGLVPKTVSKIKEEVGDVKEEVGRVKEEVGEVKFSELKELKVCVDDLNAVSSANFRPRKRRRGWRSKWPSSGRRERLFGIKWPPSGSRKLKARPDLLGQSSRPRENQPSYR